MWNVRRVHRAARGPWRGGTGGNQLSCLWTDDASTVAREAARQAPPPPQWRGVALTLPLALVYLAAVALVGLCGGGR